MVHLHVHTEGSPLDGMSKIKELIKRALELNMKAIGISDHGNMIKSLEFQEECIKNGIKPILGCEFYISEPDGKKNYHILCIAKNNTGLKNLFKLNKYAYMNNFYYKPRITFEQLMIHKEGLIVTSACIGSEFGQEFLGHNSYELAELVRKYKNTFGNDFYLEIQPNEIPEQRKYNEELVLLAQMVDIPLIVTTDAHYVNKEDSVAHDVMLAMQVKKKVNDPDRFRFTGDSFYIKSEEEIYRDLSYLPTEVIYKAICGTNEIANQCTAKIETGLNLLPHIHGVADNDLELAKHCNIGFNKRVSEGMPSTKEYIDRVKFELSIIKQKGYAGYFLVVEDYMAEAKRRDILVGAGRGSGAGSLVLYILGITNVDPIKYHLLFERMLNPERISEPDVDSDFEYARRHEMVEYVKEKYGADNVCTVMAEGTMACNAVVRKVMGAFDYEQAYINRICKTIPKVLGITVEEAYNTSVQFKDYMDKHSKEYEIIKSLEGIMSYLSKHAAGIVISPKPLDEVIPVMRDEDDNTMLKSQYDKYKIAEVGLYKFDFLGIKTLTIMKETMKAVKKNYGVDIDLSAIDMEDPIIYEVLNSGDLAGIFQFDAPAGKQTIEAIKPTTFNDIVAGTSICRPGVKERELYIKNKTNGYERTGNKIVDDILEETYGAIVYQEQTMLIMNRLTGGRWTLGKADKMRKVKDLEEYREDFVDCCVSNGIHADFAHSIFDRFDLGYTFNKSHAVSYSISSAQTAWLMGNYRKEFMSAVMTIEKDKNDSELASQIKLCKKYGIKILPPDINNSVDSFIPTLDGIIYPLTAIINVGEVAVEEIIKKRPYIDFADFESKVSSKVNKRVKANLIKVGSFDSVSNVNRNLLLADFTKEQQMTYSKEIEQMYEKSLLGFSLTTHPMQNYPSMPFDTFKDGKISIPGMITGIKVIKDKKGNDMSFIKFENALDEFEGIMFSFVYAHCSHLLVDNVKVMVTGKKEGKKILVDELRCL